MRNSVDATSGSHPNALLAKPHSPSAILKKPLSPHLAPQELATSQYALVPSIPQPMILTAWPPAASPVT